MPDRPSTILRKKIVGIRDWLSVGLGILLATGTILGGAYAYANESIDARVASHDKDKKSHPLLVKKIGSLETSRNLHAATLFSLQHASKETLIQMVRMISADREREPSLKYQAADFYEEQLKILLVEHKDDHVHAFRKALNVTWAERYNMLRGARRRR